MKIYLLQYFFICFLLAPINSW